MKILTIQSPNLILSKGIKTFPIANKCNYPNAKRVYEHLFEDYNKKKGTNYQAFFWGFSNLCEHTYAKALVRAIDMLGLSGSKELKRKRVFILNVPDGLCLETDFYNFSDEIFFSEQSEPSSNWDSIYNIVESRERQVIFPYMEYSMILGKELIHL